MLLVLRFKRKTGDTNEEDLKELIIDIVVIDAKMNKQVEVEEIAQIVIFAFVPLGGCLRILSHVNKRNCGNTLHIFDT